MQKSEWLVLNNIDWNLLFRQKTHLIEYLLDCIEKPDKEIIEGLVNFLDSLHDEAVEKGLVADPLK